MKVVFKEFLYLCKEEIVYLKYLDGFIVVLL